MKESEKKATVTIVDLARMAGVHPSTVSRVFSGKAPVKTETAELILQLAERYDFQINRQARKLVKGQGASRIIGIAVPLFTHPFYTEILKGIHEYFEEKAINLMLFNLGRHEAEVFEKIVEEGLAGLLVISHALSDQQIQRLKRARIPTVLIDQSHPDLPSVTVNNRLGGRLAADFLLAKGARQILYVGEDFCSDQQDERRAGFWQQILAVAGQAPAEIVIKQNRQVAQAALTLYLQDHPVDGIFCYCDEMAYGAIDAIRAVGRPIALVGFDDLVPSQYLGLTTVAQPGFALGHQGSLVLQQLIDGHNQGPLATVLEPMLQLRQT